MCGPRPNASWATASAIAGRPLTHGPHWPALCSARKRRTRAVSARPHPPAGSTRKTPAPNDAPASRSAPGVAGVSSAAPPGSQLPKNPPASTAWTPPISAQPPARPSTSRTGIPRGISWTPGRLTAPATVTSAVPGAVSGAGGAEPARAVPADQRDVGQCLYVADQRRPAAHAALEGSWRREPRQRWPAIEVPDQGGFRAGHVPLRHQDELDLNRVARAALRDGGGEHVRLRRPPARTGTPTWQPLTPRQARSRRVPGAARGRAATRPSRWQAPIPCRSRPPPRRAAPLVRAPNSAWAPRGKPRRHVRSGRPASPRRSA